MKRNDLAQFKKDDIGIFPPSDDTNRLLGLGVCELTEPVYIRSLRNYAPSYRELRRRTRGLVDDIARINRRNTKLAETNTLTASQITYREDEQVKLKADLARFVYERDQIKKYQETLTATVTAKRNKLSFLYRANHKLAADLAGAHRALTEEINRRTIAAADAP